MLPLKRILWPTDFSDASYQALPVAQEFASRFSAELWVAYVVKPMAVAPNYELPPVPTYEEERLKSATEALERVVEERIGKELSIHTRVVKGAPALEIVRIVEVETIDMIVIATHGESGFQHLVFGSVTEKVIRLASCPVLVIRAKQKKR